MGNLILCKNKMAAKPYFIEETAQNVYTLEELSYYIVCNTYLLDSSFMTAELCKWISEEVGDKALAHQLMTFIAENVPLNIFVGHILGATNYLTQNEIKETITQIKIYENKTDEQRQKMKADRFMQKDLYVEAIFEYESLLQKVNKSKSLTAPFIGEIQYNLGCAYARLFNFSKAASMFELAYRNTRSTDSMEHMLYALRCAKDKKTYEDVIAFYQIPEAVTDKISDTLADITSSDAVMDFGNYVNGLRFKSDLSSISVEAKKNLDEWKESYTKMSHI